MNAMVVFHPIRNALAAALACCITSSSCCYVVQSFSPVSPSSMAQQNRYRRPTTESMTSMQLFEEYMSEDYKPPDNNDHSDDGKIEYGMGGVDLSQRWIELVSGGHIVANVDLSSDAAVDSEDDRLRVRYGVRLLGDDDEQSQQRLSEFAEMILPTNEEKKEDHDDSNENNNAFIKLRNHIMSINTTLAEMQSSSGSSGMAIDCIYDGPYAIQLQLVRTLRPPRSKEMTSSSTSTSKSKEDEKDSCQPPPYDSSKDSFLVGPLRLFGHGEFHGEGNPREKAAQIAVPRNKADDETTTTSWDVYHNISPVDPRGHFLLLPDIGDEKQWRDQSLNSDDCHDLTYLASTIEPRGSMVISFNSVSAGASQNHIHAHAWPNPPPPLLYRNDPTAEYDSVYAVTKASSLASIKLAQVNVSLLRYPCTCVKLSASENEEGEETSPATLKEMSDTLSKIIAIAQKMKIPHNVVWTNSDQNIDTYIFFRKAETLQIDGNMFRLGASEMLGLFHASSKEELFSVKKYRGLSCYGSVNVLSDISYEPTQHIWAEVSSALGKTTSRRLMALKRAELYKKEKRSQGDRNVMMSSGPRYVRTGVPYDTDDNDDDDV